MKGASPEERSASTPEVSRSESKNEKSAANPRWIPRRG